MFYMSDVLKKDSFRCMAWLLYSKKASPEITVYNV